MPLPRVLVFASGSKTGGGSGFEQLVLRSRGEQPELAAEIIGVVSNNESGGVQQRADTLGVPFHYFPGPWDARHYQEIAQKGNAEWFALSGWLKMVQGLPAERTFNIHPALLSEVGGRFGGAGMWGSHVLDAVYESLQKGETKDFGVSMHFVTDEYDRGPVFFEYRIPYEAGMSKEEVGALVHQSEHDWQSKITNLVVHGEISWDGHDSRSLRTPEGYAFLPRA